jgi:hypothetical protein
MSLWLRFALPAALLAACSTSLPAQTGLLIVAHGAGAEWNGKVRETVAQVSWPDGPTALAFLMGPEAQTAGWDAAVDTLIARRARSLVVVPLLVSSHGEHYHEIAGYVAGTPDTGHLHADFPRRLPLPLPARLTTALDSAPEVALALAARWAELEPADRRRPVVVVAHGPGGDAAAKAWIADLEVASRALREAGLAQESRVALLRDDAPADVRAAAIRELRDTTLALAARAQDSVVVLTALISSGAINYEKIPADLAGLPVRYRPTALAPLPVLARWIERVAREAESR